jgi:hypothetical protein
VRTLLRVWFPIGVIVLIVGSVLWIAIEDRSDSRKYAEYNVRQKQRVDFVETIWTDYLKGIEKDRWPTRLELKQLIEGDIQSGKLKAPMDFMREVIVADPNGIDIAQPYYLWLIHYDEEGNSIVLLQRSKDACNIEIGEEMEGFEIYSKQLLNKGVSILDP